MNQAQSSDKLRYGDLIALRLAKDEFYLSTPGFINTDIELVNHKRSNNSHFIEAIFQIVPPLSFESYKKSLEI